jgi:hypothetical protein
LRLTGDFLRFGYFCVQKPDQLFRYKVFLEYLQFTADPKFAHAVQQWRNCFENKPLHTLFFVCLAQQDFDPPGIG